MLLLVILVALITLATCVQVYQMTESRANGTLINVILIATAVIVSFSIVEVSTAPTTAQDTSNIPILDTTFVSSATISDRINATGAITANREVGLAFQYSSPVIEVLVDVGDRVQAGDVLARLDADDIIQNFENAIFNVQNQQINLDQLVGAPREVDLLAAETALRAAELSLGGSTVLTGPGSTQAEIQRVQFELAKNRMWQTAMQRDDVFQSVVGAGTQLDSFEPYPDIPFGGRADLSSQQEQLQENYDGALAQYYSLQNNLNAADANRAYSEAQYQAELIRPPTYGGIGGAGIQRTQAEQQLDRLLNGPDTEDLQFSQTDLALANMALAQAEIQLDYVELIAPFDGVITEMNLTVGEIPPAINAIRIMDNSVFKVNLEIDEIDIMQIRVGQDVDFIVDALPDDDITGVVEHVSLTPNQNTQVVSYNVRVALNETDAPIRDGMSTTGQVIVMQVDDVLTVEDAFILTDEVTGAPYVIVQNADNSLQRIVVNVGERGDRLSEIISGVNPGQRLVLVASGDVASIPYRGGQ